MKKSEKPKKAVIKKVTIEPKKFVIKKKSMTKSGRKGC